MPQRALHIPDGYRCPREDETPDVLVCQCHRHETVPVQKRGDHHRCVWVPLKRYDHRRLKTAKTNG